MIVILLKVIKIPRLYYFHWNIKQNFKIKLDDSRKNDKIKNLIGHFWELMDELPNRI